MEKNRAKVPSLFELRSNGFIIIAVMKSTTIPIPAKLLTIAKIQLPIFGKSQRTTLPMRKIQGMIGVQLGLPMVNSDRKSKIANTSELKETIWFGFQKIDRLVSCVESKKSESKE